MQSIKDFFLRNEESIMKTIFTSIIIFIIFLGLIISSKYFGLSFVFFNTIENTSTGTTIQNTGSVVPPVDTGSVASTGSFTREDYLKALSGTGLETVESKVNYVLSFGESGNDFSTVIPKKQNIVLGATKSSNNILIQSFIAQNQYIFNLNKNRTGYLVVKTEKRVPDAKDMILGINGMSKGSLWKTADASRFKSDISDNHLDTLYIFPLDNIRTAQMDYSMNLYTFDPLAITIVIGENNNSVESISIVYIN